MSSILKTCVLQKVLLREFKGEQEIRRKKHLQSTYLITDLFLIYMKNPLNNNKKPKQSDEKWAKFFKICQQK